MGADVVTLRTVDKPATAVDDAVVEKLTEFLGRAKNGEFNGVALLTVEADGAGSVVSVGTTWAGQGVEQNVHAVIGGIEVLKERWMRDRVQFLT